MKTFKRSTIERVIWFSSGGSSHILVKAKVRGWFVDTRRVDEERPSKKAIVACLTDRSESGFTSCRAKEFKL
jgi:hypothetical protein